MQQSNKQIITRFKCTLLHAGLFLIGTEVGAEVSKNGPNKLTLNVIAMTSTPRSSQAVTDMNNESYCGYTTWALNTGLDTYAQTCGETTNPDRGDTLYYVLQRDDDTLQLWGAPSTGADGLSADTRIVDLNEDVTFTLN